jgi:hypothetical protein
MKFVYRTLHQVLRKLIDLLMTAWIWARKREQHIQDKKDYERK